MSLVWKDVTTPSRRLPRWTRWGSSTDRPHEATGAGPWVILSLSLWFGMVGGLLELAVLLGRVAAFGKAALGQLQMSQHGLGLVPIADTLIVVTASLPLALITVWHRHRAWTRVAVLALAFLASFTVIQPFEGLTNAAQVLLACGCAAVIARAIRPRRDAFFRLARSGLPWLVGVLGLVAASPFVLESWGERRALAALPSPPPTPNVLFIVLDTLRADVLSCQGYARATTPHLDALAARGVRFAEARSPGAWTLPSHASMFTGRWPHELSARLDTPLDSTHPTLAEWSRDQGYATAGFVGNTWFCNPWYGLSRGFNHYRATPITPRMVLQSSGLGERIAKVLAKPETERATMTLPRKLAPAVSGEFLDWLDHRPDAARPFLVFLNYFDVHDPYLMGHEPAQCLGIRPRSRAERDLVRGWQQLDKRKLSERERRMARDCYDDCVAYLDAMIGQLLADLDARQLLEKTWVVVTSDHGEQFGEHGHYLHGESLYLTNYHVPLLVVPPRGTGPSPRVVADPVSLRDLPATLTDVVAPGRASPFPGRSLARFWDGPEARPRDEDEPLLYEIVDRHATDRADWRPPRALEARGMTYLRHKNGREELFDMTSDRRQTRDLANVSDHMETMDWFRRQLGRYEARAARP